MSWQLQTLVRSGDRANFQRVVHEFSPLTSRSSRNPGHDFKRFRASELVCLAVCHTELGETRQAEAALARLKSFYSQFSGITLDGILKEEDFYEDPAVVDRYRAILRRIDKEE